MAILREGIDDLNNLKVGDILITHDNHIVNVTYDYDNVNFDQCALKGLLTCNYAPCIDTPYIYKKNKELFTLEDVLRIVNDIRECPDRYLDDTNSTKTIQNLFKTP